MLSELILILSVRFFLFDFVLFKGIRIKLKEINYFFRKLFSCTFCQGFWCGLFISVIKSWPGISWSNLEFAFLGAIVSFTWTVIMDPYIRAYEDKCDFPMT